jgi:hypothetical protein
MALFRYQTRLWRKHHTKKLATKYFSIPEHDQWRFQSYSLLYWKGSHLLSRIKDGMIDGVYQVIYHPPLTRGKILANPETQYALSFRAPNQEYNLPAYVIVGEATK